MEDVRYQQIVDRYTCLKSKHGVANMQLIIDKLYEEFGDHDINEATIYSIVAWVFQQEIKRRIQSLDWEDISNRHLVDHISLLNLSQEYDVSPSLIAKKIITFKYPQYPNDAKSKVLFNNTCTIPEGKLAYECMLAQYNDIMYGPHSNFIMNNAGTVYEQDIASFLDEAGVDYLSEKELRAKQYDVTPDFKLNIPIVVTLEEDETVACIIETKKVPLCKKCVANNSVEDKEEEGSHNETSIKSVQKYIVNWIECKSLFASHGCHQDYYKNQFSSYINRFGRGIVIYRYGFVKSVQKNNPNLIVVTKLIRKL